MAKLSNQFKKIIILFLNFVYLFITLAALLVLYEYVYDIYADFSRFKIMHSSFDILRDTIAILFWIILSVFIYKYNKNLIAEDKSILIYSVIPFIVVLIFYFIIIFSHI